MFIITVKLTKQRDWPEVEHKKTFFFLELVTPKCESQSAFEDFAN